MCVIAAKDFLNLLCMLYGECGAAQDVWAGSSINLQKCSTNQCDVVQLFEFLFDRLTDADFELFLVQAWLIWNQRNKVVHGGQMTDPRWLNKRAMDYLEEYKKSQIQLALLGTASARNSWQPPPPSIYKLNFDAATFSDLNCSGFGAIIHNKEGEVMAGMSVKGPFAHNSAKAKALACRKAVKFSIEAGFSRLVIEGDNATMMNAISCSADNNSLLGHIFEDIHNLIRGLEYASISYVKRGDNTVAHSLACHARNISDEMYWLEDSPPPAVDVLYQDYLHINE